MSDMADIPASMAEAMAEIRRLRGDNELLKRNSLTYFKQADAEIARLRARIAELEVALASIHVEHVVTLGTLEKPTDDAPAPYHLERDVPPSTPR